MAGHQRSCEAAVVDEMAPPLLPKNPAAQAVRYTR